MIDGGRRFHIRTNVAVVNKLNHEDMVDVYIYNRHEVRIAGQAVSSDPETREPLAHITNGTSSGTMERALLSSIPELTALQGELRVFFKAFQAFMPDMVRRVGYSASQEMATTNGISWKSM